MDPLTMVTAIIIANMGRGVTSQQIQMPNIETCVFLQKEIEEKHPKYTRVQVICVQNSTGIVGEKK